MQHIEQFNKWKALPFLTDEEKSQLEQMSQNPDEVRANFGSNLSFGTAGLRGKMKLGTNAMNVYTVARATQGIAEHILSVTDKKVSVVIAYDSRINSELFAKKTASVFAANGIYVYIFDALRPTPELSFALRRLGCIAGVNITASHNPKEYNGYKLYWDDGAQISPEQATKISALIEQTDIATDIKSLHFDTAVRDGMIQIIGKEIDEEYLSSVMSQAIDPEMVESVAEELSIVYTPLHGAGAKMVPEALSRLGIKKLYTVDEQMAPDGSFPTVKKPNPEYPDVFTIGISIADRVGSDLIVATDPDADRVGIMVKDHSGKFVPFNGNQTGALLLDYIIGAYARTGKTPPAPYAVKSIVTTELMDKICRAGGVKLYNVLTGFKYIGEVIKINEAAGTGSFIFGAEESYGYLKGTYARDKDAVVASMLICEMTCYYKTLGMTLYDALEALYKKYGFSLEKTDEMIFDGYDGADKIRALMAAVRSPEICELGGVSVESVWDYRENTVRTSDGKVSAADLPSADVVRFLLSNGDVFIARPSGTEPKLKLYYLISAPNKEEASDRLGKYMNAISNLTK